MDESEAPALRDALDALELVGLALARIPAPDNKADAKNRRQALALAAAVLGRNRRDAPWTLEPGAV